MEINGTGYLYWKEACLPGNGIIIWGFDENLAAGAGACSLTRSLVLHMQGVGLRRLRPANLPSPLRLVTKSSPLGPAN
jgi:hypothetical protein